MDFNPDLENFEITFSCASAEPFERYDEQRNEFYFERLVITDDAIDFSRLDAGASILKNHDPEHILGVVQKAWIEDGKVCIRARFRKNDPEAAAAFRDAVDGTLPNVSIGYMVNQWIPVKEGGINFRDVTRWTPFEVSAAVGVPADPTVGFYRSILTKKGAEMPENEETKPAEETAAAENAEAEQKSCCEEQKECSTCEQKNSDEAETKEDCACKEGEDDSDKAPSENQDESMERAARKALRDLLTGDPEMRRSFNIPTTNKRSAAMPQEKFNLARAFRAAMSAENCLEKEISSDLYRAAGVNPSGEHSIMIPFTRELASALMHRAFPDDGFIGGNGGPGAGLQANENRPDLFVEYIRNRIGVKNATFLTGLNQASYTFPVQTGTGSVAWVEGLNTDVGATKPTVTNITLTPHKLGAHVAVGKDLILSGNPNAVNIALNDLLALIAQKIGLTILKGNASSPTITGVNTATGVQTVTIADVTSATWADMLAFAAKVEGKEINSSAMEFIMSAADKQTLKGISKDVGSGRFLCEGDEIDGRKVSVDGNLVTGEIFFGDFSNVLVGQWGGIEIMLDPYKYALSGGMDVIASTISDIAVRNPQLFVKAVRPVATT